MPPRRRSVLVVWLAAVMVAGAAPAVTAAAEPQFPSGDAGFHTYAELSAVVAQAEADHPAIVDRFSIGQSHQGRELWAVKISDHVATDEPEPEVLFDGLHHGDEHMSLEMTLAILGWLTDGYGTDERVTSLVNGREIWILFAINPDGATYDIAGTGDYRSWRKNRQPTPGSTSVGTDLNRNYPYKWGCCEGSSASPSSSRYRGPSALSAPESRAFVDFVRSRVVGGRQQIRLSISFHTTGRLVMYPYGHTTTNVTGDMTAEDYAVLTRMAGKFAATNGYHPQQASDLYPTSGTSRDWLYATYRIFAFTFELSPDSTPYPKDEAIPSETGRNRTAILDAILFASCPYGQIGKSTDRCGALDDDFEVTRGWARDLLGTDTATGGVWQRGIPGATTSSGPKQLATTTSGTRAFVTGTAAGSSASANDLDGGTTTVSSPPVALPTGTGQRLTFRYSVAHGPTSSTADWFRVEVVPPTGAPTTVLQVPGAASDRDGAWVSASISMDAWAGQTVRIRLAARDGGSASLFEVQVDDVRVTRPTG